MAGFYEAQASLVERMGQQVVLLFEQETVWPDGTKLDPESGKPLNPWVAPISSGFTEWTGSGAVGRRVAQKSQLQSDVQFEPIGVLESGPAQIIIPVRDYPVASGEAKRAIVQGREWKVEDTESDGHRYIVSLEPR